MLNTYKKYLYFSGAWVTEARTRCVHKNLLFSRQEDLADDFEDTTEQTVRDEVHALPT